MRLYYFGECCGERVSSVVTCMYQTPTLPSQQLKYLQDVSNLRGKSLVGCENL